ncbi:hypothetical protein [Mesorhizobium loti]|uniref:Uncharacterized protein n=1 Tax=Mesorhizobium loti R88b TaxID=935548 RepID=A0A6M7WWN6_RHILI|nr:hypothetical protein [Mesorhizobium loti]QKD04268.1 hypothetical protein EB235_24605 [Mesorhizobium loti R88b]
MNDDNPKRAEDFASLADRRTWLDSLPDERVRITTTPTQKRLRAANDNKRLAALEAVDALLAPHVPNCLPDTFETLDKEGVGAGWRMRPSIQEIQRAMLGRVFVRTGLGQTHSERWQYRTLHIGALTFTMCRRTERGPVLAFGKVVTGDIIIPAGAMIGRGLSKKGTTLKPSEYRTFEKPAIKATRSATCVRDYVNLAGAWEPEPYRRVAIQPLSAGRTPFFSGANERAIAASALLAEAYANTPNLPLVTSLPTAYGAADGFTGGVSRVHGSGSSHDGHGKRASDEAIRTVVKRWLSEKLDGFDMRILSLATSSATSSESGANLGMTRHRFVRAANDALEKVAMLLVASTELATNPALAWRVETSPHKLCA